MCERQKIEEQESLLQLTMTKGLSEASQFVLTRYPYFCAVLLMVNTADWIKQNLIDASIFRLIYGLVGMYFITGTVLSYNLFRLKRFFAFVMIILVMFGSYLEYQVIKNEQFLLRLLSRNIACVGCYFMIMGGIDEIQGKNTYLSTFGRQLLGVYAMLSAMLIWNSESEFDILTELLPGTFVSTYIGFFLFTICCICMYGGYQIRISSTILACLIFMNMLFIDLDTQKWKKLTEAKSWEVITMACKNIPVLSALILLGLKEK